MKNTECGMSLLELCLAMAIAIITAESCCYTYQKQQQAMDRKNAELYLQEISLALAAHKSINDGYAHLNLTQLEFNDTQNNYNYYLNTSTNTFLIEAQPSFEDTCGKLSLNQANQRTSTGLLEECWN